MITSSLDCKKTKICSIIYFALFIPLPLASAEVNWFRFPFCRSPGRISALAVTTATSCQCSGWGRFDFYIQIQSLLSLAVLKM